MKKTKNVNLRVRKPFSTTESVRVISANQGTVIKTSHGIVGIIMAVPLVACAVWLINLLSAYFSPAPAGAMAAPISTNKIFALVAFMIGYSIFLTLYYFSRKKK